MLSRRLWLAACCLTLTACAFVTRPGYIIADTKIDMAVNPLGFLSRALHLWDPAQFGQLQNQAVGYFFPMGPFFVLGKLMALPAWVVQRLWLAAILIAAFAGVVRLAARLGIGTLGTQIAAGFAYALSPIGLSLLGVNSGEFLPAAMLPWILIPLVRMVREGSGMSAAGRARAAAQSAVAVALCSGMNATSVLAMLVPAMIYLVTAERPAPRWRIMAWWVPAVVLACSSWLIALVLLGRYGVSMLPYSESAQITTSVTSLSSILRGTEYWTTYTAVNGQPWSPVGFMISTRMLPTILTGVTAGLGLTGLVSGRLPNRRFLLAVLVSGVVIVGAGYLSGLGNPIAGPIDHVINGPLAPLRNLHKFDPMIRLPVALGLAHLLSLPRVGWRRQATRLAAAAGLAGVALPAAMTGFSAAGSFPVIPSYWIAATNWLDKHAGHQAVLAVPGAPFGEYVWGRPMDDVLEATFSGEWAGQQLATLGSVGEQRLLMSIDQRLAAGQGSAGLAQVLGQMGVKYILVRNDLIYSDISQSWPARIDDALYSSPGIVKVAQFGTFPVGNAVPDDAVSNFQSLFPPVEIFAVTRANAVATVVPASDAVRVYGAPESVLTLADQGLLKGNFALLNSDSPQIAARSYVITDSLRRRTRNFGEVGYDYSATLTAKAPAATFEAASDYLDPGWRYAQAVARYNGIASVSASSSSAGILALPDQSATGRLPFAAVDGDLRTIWESGSLTGPDGQWLRIAFDRPLAPHGVTVAFADNVSFGPAVTKVAVSTAAGTVTDGVRQTGAYQPLRVPTGRTRWLRITVVAVAGPAVPGSQVGIAEVNVPSVAASRTIVAPTIAMPSTVQPTVVLARAEPQPSGCMLTSFRWVCSPSLVKPTEEQYGFDHAFTSAGFRQGALSGLAVLTDPALVRRYAWFGKPQPQVTASSVYTPDPEDQPTSAFDGSAATAWIASASDHQPILRISWHTKMRLTGVRITRPPGASLPLQVLVTGSGDQLRGGIVGKAGMLRFTHPMRTNRLTFIFTPSQLPLQISEVHVPGVAPLRFAQRKVALRCGLGPTLTMNGKLVPTRATGTVTDLLQGRPLSFSACSAVTVRTGANRVVEPGMDRHGFAVQSVVVDPLGTLGLRHLPRAHVVPATVLTWGPATRVIRVTAQRRSYLAVAQNFNAGWQASADGKALQAVRFDGWMQGWILPAGTRGLVVLTFVPDSTYRGALFAGLAILALLIVISVVPAPRRRVLDPSRSSQPAEPEPRDAPAPASLAEAPGQPRRAFSAFWQLRAFAGKTPGTGPTAVGLVSALLAALAGLGGASMLGLWLAGYPGAALAPVVAVIFTAAVACQHRVSILAAIASPWMIGFLLMAVCFSTLGGDQLAQAGAGGSAVAILRDTGPQLACLVIVIRLAVALVIPSE